MFGYAIVGPNGIIRQPEQVLTLYPGDPPVSISLGPDENIQGYSITNSPGQSFFMSITQRMTPVSPQPPVVQPPVIQPPVVQPPVVQPPVIQPPVVQPPVIQPPQPPITPQVPPTTTSQPSVPGQPPSPGLPPSTFYTPSGSAIPWAVWAISQTNPSIGRVSPEWFLYPYRGGQARQYGTGQTSGQLPPGVVSPPTTGVFNGRFYPSTSFRPVSSGATGVFGSSQPPQTYPRGTPYYYSTSGE